MKTIVETFVVEETAELIYDNEKLEQWNQLVKDLNLVGQEGTLKKDKSPVPFMSMNSTLINILETICPMKTDIANYSKMPIPVEILSLVQLSKNEGYFEKIEIWSDDKNPDPVCVGYRWPNEATKSQGYSWNMERYLIGKWGDVRKSFEQLKEIAMKRWKKAKEMELKERIKRDSRDLEDLDILTYNFFGSNSELPF